MVVLEVVVQVLSEVILQDLLLEDLVELVLLW